MSSVQSTPWACGRLGAKHRRPRRSTMPGAPTPTGAAPAAPSPRSSSTTTCATASATWLPTTSRLPVGVGTRASATTSSAGPSAMPSTFVPPMSMP